MAHFTFHGGLELPEEKDSTKDSPIREILPGRRLVFPLMHAEQALVIPGEYVISGQLIAKGTENNASRIHSSVSGIVKKIEEYQLEQGNVCQSIVIENDGKYKEVDFGDFVEADDMDQQQIYERIKSAGIVDCSDRPELLDRKLDIKEPNKIRHIIVNCAECEPYLTSKYRCCVERPEWIVEGLRILLKLFPNAKGIFAIENDRPDAITALQKIFADSRNMKIIPMKRKYPQDMERMLIYACTGKKINSSKTAAEARCIVLGSDTVYDICNAVTFGRPSLKRVVTVSGNALKEPVNAEVRFGTELSELIEAAGGYREQADRVLCGGPMRGTLISDIHKSLTKEMPALICLKKDQKDKTEKKSEKCIGCGFCVDVCSVQLLPVKLAGYAVTGNREQFFKLGGMECCECGSCSYICPSGLPLTEAIRKMKKQSVSDQEEQERS